MSVRPCDTSLRSRVDMCARHVTSGRKLFSRKQLRRALGLAAEDTGSGCASKVGSNVMVLYTPPSKRPVGAAHGTPPGKRNRKGAEDASKVGSNAMVLYMPPSKRPVVGAAHGTPPGKRSRKGAEDATLPWPSAGR